ncbi:uroporphyrinogen-III synthase [Wenzhouxiangella sp. EGI_FJ10305]|uniref:uroporphyrinogen-III synthase n=1 Tax=Wenzhouxiangella sp. EGI_FJ10305 TaxID=3243768 RepID=UPI0035DF2FF5
MSEKTLVLITRTRPAAQQLAERVAELGLEPYECAPFRLQPPERPATVADDLATALPADRVILTSHEAVRQAVSLVGAAALNRSLIIVPGQGTASIARELGLDNVIFPERHGTSEAVLGMPELRDVEGLEILILAAAGGRSLMGEVLERRGAAVERIHVYRRVPCELPPDASERICATKSLVTLGASLEAVAGLVDRLPDAARKRVFQALLVVPSQRVAEHAEKLGFRHCVAAGGASDDAMMARLERSGRFQHHPGDLR